MNRKILLTNDDGILSDGLIRLARMAKKFGEVWVVAPEAQRSAFSHAITLRHAIEAWEVDFPVEEVHAFACNGTPADCVRIGALNITPGKPDAVFCGINDGYNVASDLQYSATVGAAMEAAFQQIHVIAFSEEGASAETITGDALYGKTSDALHIPKHEVTDHYLEKIAAELLDAPLAPGEIWNVNFPGCLLEQCGGILYDRQVSKDLIYRDRYLETPLANGRISYMVEGTREWNAAEGTDLAAVLHHCISIGRARNIF